MELILNNKKYEVLEKVNFDKVIPMFESDLDIGSKCKVVTNQCYIVKDIPNKLIFSIHPTVTADGNFWSGYFESAIGYSNLFNTDGKEIDNLYSRKIMSTKLKNKLKNIFKDNKLINIENKLR